MDRKQKREVLSRRGSLGVDGGGEMGELTRTFDWSKTPVGRIAEWPQSLRTAVQIILDSRYPMFLWWGRDLTNFYNDAYIPVLGGRHPDAFGKSAAQVWSEVWTTVGPQTELVLNEGRATWNEELLLLVERNEFLEETYFTFSYSPVLGDDGNVAGVFCACSEETQQVLSHRRLSTLRALAEETAQAKTTKRACEAAVAVLKENQHCLPFTLFYLLDEAQERAHLAGLTGIDCNEVSAPAVIELSGQDAPWPLQQALATGGSIDVADLPRKFGPLPGGVWPESPTRAVLLPMAKPGQTKLAGFIVAGISPRLVLDDDYRTFLELLAGQVANAVANARAYEEERKRAEALAELDRAKTAFFSNVSHEFRTPLTLILGPLEDSLADAEHSLAPEQHERLEIVHRNSLRLLKLVNSLLDFSRIEAGRTQACYEPTDLSQYTCELASSFRSACEKAGLKYTLNCVSLPEPTYVDRDMWEKVVLNLISNAFKFTLEGEIEVGVSSTAGNAELRVRDTGVGVPSKEMPKLFDRFYRVEGTRGRTQEGSGIGLALVQELVRLHGGQVRAESEVGRGTTFFVTVPFGKSHLPPERVGSAGSLTSTSVGAAPFVEEAIRWLPTAADQETSAPAESLVDNGTQPEQPILVSDVARPSILWADDNTDMRQYVARLLAPKYDVTSVSNGSEALHAVQENLPDLVLADVMMPHLDGFGLLRELRSDPRTRDLPVVLLSARAGEEERVEGVRGGADDYLIKPFSAKELLARVDTHLTLSQVRRQAADKLRESEARFRTMAENAPVMIWVTDSAGRCTYLNRRWHEFTGTAPGLGTGFGWLDSIHPGDRSAAEGRFISSSVEKKPSRVEYRLRRHDGQYRWAIDSAAPRFGSDGELLGYIGSVLDITDLKRVETELREADKRKDEFLAMLAHELRNPLSPIRSGLELLAIEEDETNRPTITIMQEQVEHLVRLVDDLLDVSRIMRGRIELRREMVRLSDLVNRSVDSIRPLANSHRHQLSVSVPEQPLWLNVDPIRIVQVIENLLTNATKYCEAGGRIEVNGTREGEQAVISVRDTGIGIEPDLLPKVFDLFTQSSRSLDRAQGGLGIGLTLVHRLVAMHGGTVTAASEGVGRGSTFIVRLPVAKVAGVTNDKTTRGKRVRGRRILVVDDNRAAAMLLSRLLAKHGGHRVQTAGEGRTALQMMEDFCPEIVFLDIGLPGQDGHQVARKIRQNSRFDEVMLVALTGYGQDADRQKSKAAGIDVHLVKPPSMKQINEVLAGLAGHR